MFTSSRKRTPWPARGRNSGGYQRLASGRDAAINHWLWNANGYYGDYDWQPLTENEAEELHDMIDMIDVDAILVASTR